MDRIYTGLESCQVRPTAAVERQLANGSAVDRGADVRTLQLHTWGLCAYRNAGQDRPNLHGQVKSSLRPDVQNNSRPYLRGESLCADRDFIISSLQVRRIVKAIVI